MIPFLRPSSTLTETEVNRSLRWMIAEGTAGFTLFALASGGFMAAFALALGANNLQIGVLAALPFVTQIAQLPAILAVEKLRLRKLLGIPSLAIANLMWAPVGAVPFLMDTPGSGAVFALMALIAFRGIFASIWGTCWASWMSHLVPQEILGRYYSRRLAIMTATIAVVSLGASFFVNWWTSFAPPENAVYAYSFLLIGGALTLGLASPASALAAKEPLMAAAVESGRSVISVLTEPLRDRNYSQLLRFLLVWSFASNLAIPFFAVYMLTNLGLSLPTVIGFTVLSQATYILFARMWGPFADRVGSKTVLSMASSLYLLVIIGWTFTTLPGPYFLTLPLLAVLHAFAGIAAAGVMLTVSTLALKIAPEGRETPFLGMAGIATNVGIGVGPIVGGLMADYFAVRGFEIELRWTSPSGILEFPAFALSGFDFLFLIAFVVGVLSLNLLVALREEGEVPRGIALGELSAGQLPAARVVSSVPGLNAVSAFSVGYLKRVPGADVAMGVTAYQLAASTKAAAASASRSRAMASEVSGQVSSALQGRIDDIEDVAEKGLELARHSTRGAVEAGEDLVDRVGELTRGALTGTVRVLARSPADTLAALRGAGYGAVEGAANLGGDLGQAAENAVSAALEMSLELGIPEDEVAQVVAAGALDAAAAEGREALDAVQEALPDSIPHYEPGLAVAKEE